MCKKIILAVIAIAVIGGIGYLIYLLGPGKLTETGKACVNSGGAVLSSLCCQLTGDFPNSCLIGPCGCSLENSHPVKICDCGEGKCFNGKKCVSLSGEEEICVNKCGDGTCDEIVVWLPAAPALKPKTIALRIVNSK